MVGLGRIRSQMVGTENISKTLRSPDKPEEKKIEVSSYTGRENMLTPDRSGLLNNGLQICSRCNSVFKVNYLNKLIKF